MKNAEKYRKELVSKVCPLAFDIPFRGLCEYEGGDYVSNVCDKCTELFDEWLEEEVEDD